jgi:hypothetical protein
VGTGEGDEFQVAREDPDQGVDVQLRIHYKLPAR